jgi:hypothetical protein
MRSFVVTILLALPALAQNQPILENGWARVVMGATVPGQLSRPHVHKINRVMIHLDRGAQRIVNLESNTSKDIPFTAGQVRWDPRVGLHTSENTGGTAFKIVEVELNDNPPRKSPAPAKLPATPHKIELENNQVRVLRVIVPPRESTKISSPFLAVGLPSGQTHFHEGNTTIENKSVQTTEWIIVELK